MQHQANNSGQSELGGRQAREHPRTQDLAEAKSREKTGSALQQLGLDLTDRYLMSSVPTKPKGSASLWDLRIQWNLFAAEGYSILCNFSLDQPLKVHKTKVKNTCIRVDIKEMVDMGEEQWEKLVK